MRRQTSGTAARQLAPSQARWTATLSAAMVMFLLLVSSVTAQTDGEDEEPVALHERLTEREDESRLDQPYSVEVMGRPLFLSGQFELSLDFLDRLSLGADETPRGRLLLEPELEGELFYSFGDHLSLFAQLRVAMEQDLRDDTPERMSTRFVERGEMWLSSMDVAGSGLDLEFGRLDFEDDRLWWWDTDLDALRVSHESDEFEWALSWARELAPDRSDRHYIEAEHDGVQRLLFEATWDWSEEHTLQGFALLHRDHSSSEALGQQVRQERADESDARLLWLGLRAAGAWSSEARGLLGYWLDVAQVRGDEWVIEYDEDAPGSSVVEDISRQRVRGWGYDAGVTWLLPLALEPRLSLAVARTSGDRQPGDDVDRSFRQTGLHANEIGFGGVQRFGRYGELLDPELSNLSIATAGVGISLFESSSLDLLYHRYRLVEPAESLRDVRIDVELTGTDRDIGQAFDLVLAVEEWQRFELELSGLMFKPGRAFGTDHGDWVFGGFMALRVAF